MSLKMSVRARLLVVAVGPALALLSPTSAGSAAVPLVHAPQQRIDYATSTNWSGYASTSGPFSSASAAWVEPAGKCTSKTTYSAFWVGIDGDGSNSVEQTGSSVDCVGGSPRYYAWYEMYPAFPVNYGDTVRAGDSFTASVTASGTNFTLTISDTTQGWSHTQHKTSAIAQKFSAEVIAEAPSSGGGNVLPLTNFGTAKFTSARANGVAIGTLSPARITMVSGSTVKARPSALSGGQNFSVVWHHN
jgi:Peptidase A4 family